MFAVANRHLEAGCALVANKQKTATIHGQFEMCKNTNHRTRTGSIKKLHTALPHTGWQRLLQPLGCFTSALLLWCQVYWHILCQCKHHCCNYRYFTATLHPPRTLDLSKYMKSSFTNNVNQLFKRTELQHNILIVTLHFILRLKFSHPPCNYHSKNMHALMTIYNSKLDFHLTASTFSFSLDCTVGHERLCGQHVQWSGRTRCAR